jgi:hypothetical protein
VAEEQLLRNADDGAMSDKPWSGRPADTSPEMDAKPLELIKALTPGERGRLVFALSGMARQVAWTGAERHAGHLGPDAVRRRFLTSLYGAAEADRIMLALGQSMNA